MCECKQGENLSSINKRPIYLKEGDREREREIERQKRRYVLKILLNKH